MVVFGQWRRPDLGEAHAGDVVQMLGDALQVAPLHQIGDGLRLDRRRLFIALVFEGAKKNLGEAEIRKFSQDNTFAFARAVRFNRRRAIKDKPRVSGRLSGIGRQDSGGSDA